MIWSSKFFSFMSLTWKAFVGRHFHFVPCLCHWKMILATFPETCRFLLHTPVGFFSHERAQHTASPIVPHLYTGRWGQGWPGIPGARRVDGLSPGGVGVATSSTWRRGSFSKTLWDGEKDPVRFVGWNGGFFGGLEMFHSLKAFRWLVQDLQHRHRTYRYIQDVQDVQDLQKDWVVLRQMWLKQLLTPGAHPERSNMLELCTSEPGIESFGVFWWFQQSPHVQAHMGMTLEVHALNFRVGPQRSRQRAVLCCDLYWFMIYDWCLRQLTNGSTFRAWPNSDNSIAMCALLKPRQLVQI